MSSDIKRMRISQVPTQSENDDRKYRYTTTVQYNTIQYNKLYLKSENIKHYNTSSNELLNPT
jgi:hypothetical protein